MYILNQNVDLGVKTENVLLAEFKYGRKRNTYRLEKTSRFIKEQIIIEHRREREKF